MRHDQWPFTTLALGKDVGMALVKKGSRRITVDGMLTLASVPWRRLMSVSVVHKVGLYFRWHGVRSIGTPC